MVYFDPPYVPLTDTANFASYTAGGFGSGAAARLAQCFRRLATNGATCILSNSDTPLVRDLYAGLDIRSVSARRNVNSDGAKRGQVGEVLVVHKGVTC